jgi:hypothetical protein
MQGYLISRRGGYRIRSAEIDRFLVGGDDLLPVAPARLIAEAETSQFDQDEP